MAPRSASLGRSKLSVKLKETVRHPIEMLYRARGRLELAQERTLVAYQASPRWEEELHRWIDAPWPCDLGAGFHVLWSDLAGTVDSLGRGHDADPAFARALWCTVAHTRPERVVECGVGRGISTRFILEAMRISGRGHLWSIDLPPLLEGWRAKVGEAVPESLRDRWSYVRGPGRIALPRLLRHLGSVDVLIHDSLHTAPTVRRELSLAWPALRRGGLLVVDGIQRSVAFRSFTSSLAPETSLIGAHELKRGYVGLARKPG